jgi:hypothetical protein
VVEDHLHAGVLGATLQPGESFTIVASTESAPLLDGDAAYQKRRQHERELIVRAAAVPSPPPAQLVSSLLTSSSSAAARQTMPVGVR